MKAAVHKGQHIFERQRRLLEKTRGGAMLVTHIPDVRYLTGFTGSNGALAIAHGKLAFFTDGRYTTQAKEQVVGARVAVKRKGPITAALEWLSVGRAASVALQSAHLTMEQHAQLKKLARGFKRRMRFVADRASVSALRMVKDWGEIEQMRAAALLASSCFECALKAVRPGAAELAIAAELEYCCRRAGAEGMSFDTLVAAGERSALPHGTASKHPVPRRGFVILDYGVILGGYCSDMTRTVHVGRPSPRERSMYEAVLEAHEAAKAVVKPGATAEQVDAAARKVLKRAKLEQYFTHSTGHGVGLEIHEPPRLGKKQPDLLSAGMVITIEPGVYVPGKGGVRIEDMVLVTESGNETLTPTTKELLTL